MTLTALSSAGSGVYFISDYPGIVRIAAIVAVFASVLIILTLCVIFLYRIYKRKAKQLSDLAEEKIFEELNETLLVYDSVTDIPEEEMIETVNKLRLLKDKNTIFRRSLVCILVYFQSNLTGSVAKIISSAYSRLRLREFTLRKLRSSLWFNKTEGLTEVQGMHDGHSLPEVNRLVTDKNQDVRVAAYTVLIKLKAPNSFDFFDTEQDELSEWHQIMLEDAISKTPNLDLPDFKTRLSAQNESIVSLSIKLIVACMQFDAIPKLMSIIDHDNETMRHQIITALGDLNAESAEERLTERYDGETEKIKAAILIALGKISSGSSADFISEKFLETDHFSIMKSAAAAIVAHPEGSKKRILRGFDHLDEDRSAILKQFEEPLIIYGSD